MNNQRNANPDLLSHLERIILGGIAGAIVGATSFPIESGYGDVFTTFDAGIVSGFGARLVFFGVLGAVWAYVHDDETNRRKVFELGLVAPAMIAGLVVANAPPAANIAKALSNIDGFEIVSTAFAQNAPATPVEPPIQQGFTERFIKGLVGK